MNRRELLQRSLAAGLASLPGAGAWLTRLAGPSKRVLILGGTNFVGPATVEAALASGHEVALFNRGITHPELFPRIEKLRGNRDVDSQRQDLSALRARPWDAVIDIWPSEPAVVGATANLLCDQADHYFFVSSFSAYENRPGTTPPSAAAVAEDRPLVQFDPAATGYRAYQSGKAECERRVAAAFGDRCTFVRPGIIKGFRDPADELAFYLVRARRGGQRIGPGTGGDHLQFVDVRDVGRYLIWCVDQALRGSFNVSAPVRTLREIMELCRAVTRSNAEFTWMPREFLSAQGLEPRRNFPLWFPDNSPNGIDYAKALRAGLRLRPVEETLLDALYNFGESHAPDYEFPYLTSAKETDVLEAWRRRT